MQTVRITQAEIDRALYEDALAAIQDELSRIAEFVRGKHVSQIPMPVMLRRGRLNGASDALTKLLSLQD